jgi:hypothetical protein
MENTSNHSGESQRFLCFRLGEEDYAVPLLSVKEVIAMPDTTPPKTIGLSQRVPRESKLLMPESGIIHQLLQGVQ